MTYLGLSDEYQMIYDSALEFARKRLAPFVEVMEREDAFPTEVWQLLAGQGYLGAGVPEQYGGSGGDYLSAALIHQAVARVSGAIALSYGAHLNLCTHNILRHGSEEQRRRHLPKPCSGKWIGGLALTEPNAGSDAMGIQMVARRDGTGWILNGFKIFITNGPIADVLVVYAKTTPVAGSRGITAFIVQTGTPGFRVAKSLEKVGMRGSPTGELTFEDVRVPKENVLGEADRGYVVLMGGLDLERAFLAAGALGSMEECLELSLRYARQRAQFGRPIGHFQLIQAKLADMYTRLVTARTYVYEVLKMAQTGERISKEAAAALLFAAESAMEAADEAVQIHGGYGYIKEFPVERIWRDAKLMEIGAGTNEIRRLIIARELLGLR
jgi:isovaleryl-CoA dehydrogenase